MTELEVLAGLLLLMVGGEFVVRGGSRLAVAAGISPVVVGLTVVAFGTSSPELAVTLGAIRDGSSEVAVGNAVGSNIYNVLLVLGIGALAAPLVVRQRIVRADVPLLIGASVLFWALASDGSLSLPDGLLMLAILVGYTAASVRSGRREARRVEREYEANLSRRGGAVSPLMALVLIAAGLGALVAGAQLLVSGASDIARSLGISELVIGLTVVAIGTSMPEIVTTVIASLRGERDLAVGNVVGSNLFNLLGVLAVGAIVAPGGMPVPSVALSFDIPVMVAVAVALLPIAFAGHAIRRWEGALFVTYAIIYTAWLVLDATGQPVAEDLATATLIFLLPLTVITVATVVIRQVRADRRSA